MKDKGYHLRAPREKLKSSRPMIKWPCAQFCRLSLVITSCMSSLPGTLPLLFPVQSQNKYIYLVVIFFKDTWFSSLWWNMHSLESIHECWLILPFHLFFYDFSPELKNCSEWIFQVSWVLQLIKSGGSRAQSIKLWGGRVQHPLSMWNMDRAGSG